MRKRIAREGFVTRYGFYFDPAAIEFDSDKTYVINLDYNQGRAIPVGLASDLVREPNGDITAEIQGMDNDALFLNIYGVSSVADRAEAKDKDPHTIVTHVKLHSLTTDEHDPWEEA